jgi:EAL domain-containing protein (putative c-di-GMP-specific phosphodiesterase class I)
MVSMSVALVLLASAGLAVYGAGGTKTALPHLFYVPIIFAAVSLGARGALTTAGVAAVVCALEPLDVMTGGRQSVSTILIRAVMFLLIGGLAAASLQMRRRFDRERYGRELRDFFDRTHRPAQPDRLLAVQVARVLRKRSFHIVFQPIYSLHSGELVSVEALARFDGQPTVGPDVWFATAHDCGRGVDLELAAIEEAIGATRDLPVQIRLAVNASPSTVVDPRLRDLVRRTSMGARLTVEITEHAIITDYQLMAEPISALRALGVLIAVDDAGAGFSSLQHVVEILPDIIKIDISLTRDVAASLARQALGHTLVDFGHRIGASVLAEGIETEADLEAWRYMGADSVQGYFTARPGPLPAPDVSPEVLHVLRHRGLALTRVSD